MGEAVCSSIFTVIFKKGSVLKKHPYQYPNHVQVLGMVNTHQNVGKVLEFS